MLRLLICLFLINILFTTSFTCQAQVFFTKNGSVRFYSKAPLEDITGINNKVTSFLNIKTGEVVFSLLIKNFQFDKSLMQDHFNENYMESEIYPKGGFKGKIINLDKIDLSKIGVYPVTIEGLFTIHGVSQKKTLLGTLTNLGEKITGSSVFYIVLDEYKVHRPSLIIEKLAEKVEVSVTMNYLPYQK